MTNNWRFIYNKPMDVYSNMAFDEALFQGYYAGCSKPTLRVYSWSNPSFSLGYFQDAGKELDLKKCAKENIDFVRRITGGGIIFHDQEITYSLICSREDLKILDSVAGSFKKICSFLINFYKSLGLDAKFAVDADDSRRLTEPCAFCFASKEKYDIVIDKKKIGGSAQKRRRNVIFQHGSIPLWLDIGKPSVFLNKKLDKNITQEICCLQDFLDKMPCAEELTDLLKKSFEQSFGLCLKEAGLNDKEKLFYQDLKEKKYKTKKWNIIQRNSPPLVGGVRGGVH
ncbi:MAG: lipoate--protein ligase family protein [Candidatus Omnitrophota bacterium]